MELAAILVGCEATYGVSMTTRIVTATTQAARRMATAGDTIHCRVDYLLSFFKHTSAKRALSPEVASALSHAAAASRKTSMFAETVEVAGWRLITAKRPPYLTRPSVLSSNRRLPSAASSPLSSITALTTRS